MIRKKTILLGALFIILLGGNIFLAEKYFSVQKQLKADLKIIQKQEFNKKALDFAKLFIEKVLKSNGEISFNTRLELETAVRNLNDEAILNQWEKFTGSSTEPEAQKNVKDLLDLVINRIAAPR